MTRSGWLSGGIVRALLAVGVGAVLFALLGGAASRGATCSVNWTGLGDGASWSDVANWDKPGGPGASDRVCVAPQAGSLTVVVAGGGVTVASLDVAEGLDIQSGSLTVTGPDASSVARLAISGGDLLGAGALSVAGTLDWTGGGMAGTGTTTVAAGATLTIDAPAASVSLHGGRTLVNEGTIAWQSGTIFAGEGAVLENAGTFTVSNDGQVSLGYGGSALIHNTGTFSKTGGAGTTLIGVAMENDGTLIATAGTLALQGGGGVETGSFGGSGGGTVSFDGGTFTLGAGASLPGTVAITNGTVDVAASVSAGSGSSVSQSGGTVEGTGTLAVAGSYQWTGGEHTGAGTTTVVAGGTLTIAAGGSSVSLHGGRTLVNQGTIAWQSGTIFAGEGAVLENAGTFTVSNDGQVSLGYGGSALIHNTGTFSKTGGAGATLIAVGMDNDGTLTATSGALGLLAGDGGNTETGSFGGIGGATVGFDNGAFTLGSGASLPGAVAITSATVDVSGAVTAGIASSLDQSGGTVTGTGALTVAGVYHWSGGEHTGTGTTTVATGGTLTIAADASSVSLHGGRALVNQGTIAWQSGSIFAGEGAVLENHGSFAAGGSNQLQLGYGGSALIHNTGTFSKTGGAGSTLIAIPIDNDGVLQAGSGTLDLQAADGTATQTGTFTSSPGAVLRFSGGTHELGPTSAVSGAGTIFFAGGTVHSTGAYSVGGGTTISSGTLSYDAAGTTAHLTQSGGTLTGTGTLSVTGTSQWTSGEQTGAGTTRVTSTGSMIIAAGASSVLLHGGRTLRNEGAISWQNGPIFAGEGAVIDNQGGFSATGDDGIVLGFGGTATLHNTGTLAKAGGTGTSTIGIDVDNDGTANAAAGTLELQSADAGAVQSGSFTASAGAAVRFSGGTHNLGAASSVSGAGTIAFTGGTVSTVGAYAVSGTTDVTNGTVRFDAAASSAGVTQSGGSLAGGGTLSVVGTYDWSGGEQTGVGTTRIVPGATLTIAADPAAALLHGGRRLLNQGTIAWQSGTVFAGEGAVIENQASFSATGDFGLDVGFGGTATLHNTGTFAKTAGTGTTTIGISVTNDGTIQAASGTLALAGGLTNYDSLSHTLTGGTYNMSATLAFANADITANAAAILLSGVNAKLVDLFGTNALAHLAANAGSLSIANGKDLTVPGSFTNSGTLRIGSADTFTDSGAFSQTGGGTLQTDIAGTSPGTTYARLSATAAALAGTLNVATDAAFHPASTDSFKIVAAGTRTGTFATVTGASLGGGSSYAVHYDPDGVTLGVSANTPPTANAQSVSTAEDTAKTLTLSASDPDAGPLTYALVSSPAHGTLTGLAPNLTYTPAPDYSGADSFTFKANDGTADSNVATVSIAVSAVDDAPIAHDHSVATNEATPLPLVLDATDVEGDALGYTIVSAPAHGTLTGTAPNLTYTPTSGYFGADAFTFSAHDASLTSNTAAVSIAVAHVNHAPVATSGSVTTNEAAAAPVTLQATDPDGDPLSYTIGTAPAHGSLSGTGATRTYTPAVGYSGTDSFTFSAGDGSLTSNTAVVSITVVHVNHPPVASDGSLTTDQGTAAAVTLQATDPDGDALAYTTVASPAHGTLAGTGSTRTYTPASGYSGSDSFTFKAGDGKAESNVATVSITVKAPLAPPPTSDEPKPQKTEVADPVTGKVLVQKTPGGPFVPLTDTDTLRFGVVFDTTKGTLRLTVAKDTQGNESTLDVTGGRFAAQQDKTLLTTLTLKGGDFGVCGKRKLAQSPPPPKKKSIRRLWGNGKGRFRTKGRYSAATVRGTHWLTDDRCDGTLTYVKRGTVSVLDFPKRRTVTVKQGHRYLAGP